MSKTIRLSQLNGEWIVNNQTGDNRVWTRGIYSIIHSNDIFGTGYAGWIVKQTDGVDIIGLKTSGDPWSDDVQIIWNPNASGYTSSSTENLSISSVGDTYQVTGAGLSEYNGLYKLYDNSYLFNEQPVYTNHTCYLFYSSTAQKWVLSDEINDNSYVYSCTTIDGTWSSENDTTPPSVIKFFPYMNVNNSNIKSGVYVDNVVGNFTDDADAQSEHLLKNKTAYVKGQKITGNYDPNSDENLASSKCLVLISNDDRQRLFDLDFIEGKIIKIQKNMPNSNLISINGNVCRVYGPADHSKDTHDARNVISRNDIKSVLKFSGNIHLFLSNDKILYYNNDVDITINGNLPLTLTQFTTDVDQFICGAGILYIRKGNILYYTNDLNNQLIQLSNVSVSKIISNSIGTGWDWGGIYGYSILIINTDGDIIGVYLEDGNLHSMVVATHPNDDKYVDMNYYSEQGGYGEYYNYGCYNFARTEKGDVYYASNNSYIEYGFNKLSFTKLNGISGAIVTPDYCYSYIYIQWRWNQETQEDYEEYVRVQERVGLVIDENGALYKLACNDSFDGITVTQIGEDVDWKGVLAGVNKNNITFGNKGDYFIKINASNTTPITFTFSNVRKTDSIIKYCYGINDGDYCFLLYKPEQQTQQQSSSAESSSESEQEEISSSSSQEQIII